MTHPDFPEVIDSTFLSSLRSCGRKTELEHLLHWKPAVPSVHLHAGAAFARGLEITRRRFYEEGVSEEAALAAGLQALMEAYGTFECPPDSAKSCERMLGALEFYFSAWPMKEDGAVPITLPSGRRGVEFGFAEPIDILHPVTGNPLIYCGRFDMLCNYAGGIFGEDDKTATSLGGSWSKQWDLRSQFTAYSWGAKQAGFPIQGFLVRGVSILKTKYDKAEAITYRPQWMIDRWYKQMLKDVARGIEQWRTGEFDYNLDHACAEYSGCIFRNICMTPPENIQGWLETGFVRRRWEPLTRTETLL